MERALWKRGNGKRSARENPLLLFYFILCSFIDQCLSFYILDSIYKSTLLAWSGLAWPTLNLAMDSLTSIICNCLCPFPPTCKCNRKQNQEQQKIMKALRIIIA